MEKKTTIAIVILAFVFAIVFVVELLVLLVPNREYVDLSKSNCSVSENIGRRVYFHKCSKEDGVVYDIRKFYYNSTNVLKPELHGIQLFKNEFMKLCQQC